MSSSGSQVEKGSGNRKRDELGSGFEEAQAENMGGDAALHQALLGALRHHGGPKLPLLQNRACATPVVAQATWLRRSDTISLISIKRPIAPCCLLSIR